MPPCVLVLGGSGFLGQYVVDALAKDGQYNVLVLSKSATQLGDHRSPAAPPPLAAADAATSAPPSPGSPAQRRRGVVKSFPGNLATGEGLYDALVEASRLGGVRETEGAGEDRHSGVPDGGLRELHGALHDCGDADRPSSSPRRADDLDGSGSSDDGTSRDPCRRRRDRRSPGLAAVVNCAAISSPAECERDPRRSRAINVPTELVDAMLRFGATRPPLLVHISTDQIYSGERGPFDPRCSDVERSDVERGDEGGETGEGRGERAPARDEKGGTAPSLWVESCCERRGPGGGRKRRFRPHFTADEGEHGEKGGEEESGDEDESGQGGDGDDGLHDDDGSRRRREFDPRARCIMPLNAYARQKADAELLLSTRYPRSICLRSSVMYGLLPRDREAVRGVRFLQFVDGALRESAERLERRERGAGDDAPPPASFFDDEFRSFVAVDDVAAAVVSCVRRWGIPTSEGGGRLGGASRPEHAAQPAACNVGGPERLSRADFALLVAESRGYDAGLVRAVPSCSVRRDVPSPRDISMDVSRLREILGIEPKSVAEALEEMPPDE